MGKRRVKKKLKQLQKKQVMEAEAARKGVPASMVFKRGKVGQSVSQLVHDLRQMFSPYTAKDLEESKRNSIRDFVSVAAPLGVSHFAILSQTLSGCNLRLMRLPQGPTFTFRVNGYSLIRDVVHAQRKPHSPGSEFLQPPLVVLNNFSQAALDQASQARREQSAEEAEEEAAQRESSPTSTLLPPNSSTLKLTSSMFQNMFPPIDVASLDVKDCRRVVMLQYEPRTCQILVRHYLITASPVGLSRGVKKLLKAQIPDLSKLDDISEYVKREVGGGASDSEAEDAPDAKITLPQSFHGRGNRAQAKSAIRLQELGPRLTLQLMKVEEEMDGGKVLYHYRRSLTESEAQKLAQQSAQRKAEKARRRAEQEANVDRKAKRQRGEAGADVEAEEGVEGTETPASAMVNSRWGNSDDEDEDAAWFRREVGEEPQEGLFERKEGERDFVPRAEQRANKMVRKREQKEKGEDSDEEEETPRKKQKSAAPSNKKAAFKGKGKAAAAKGAAASFKKKPAKK